MFFPQPEVDSIIVTLVPWRSAPFDVKDEAFFDSLVRWLFTQRNKKLVNALVPFFKSRRRMGKEEAKNLAGAAPFGEKRVRELSPKDFGALSNAFTD
jgi:16S rRNA (adenine1518-N6/adenine1519-N6)-dimethyltransferase